MQFCSIIRRAWQEPASYNRKFYDCRVAPQPLQAIKIMLLNNYYVHVIPLFCSVLNEANDLGHSISQHELSILIHLSVLRPNSIIFRVNTTCIYVCNLYHEMLKYHHIT